MKWIRKCEKGFVSNWTIEQLFDLQWVHSYLPGPDNSLFDALFRYPMLGHRVLAPIGFQTTFADLLARLPSALKASAKDLVSAPPHSTDVTRLVQG